MKIGIVLGTRPEIIKMASVIDEINNTGNECIIIHTGQHYDEEMSKQFFIDLKLQLPKYNIGSGSGTALQQISKIILELETIISEENIDIILVQGDTNAVLAGALAANKLKIPVGHVEAGLRSFDKNMPEEINRILADNCSSIFFVPTKETAINLQNEGINHDAIHVTGNTIVDACYRNLDIAIEKSKIKEEIDFEDFIVLTLHRAENVDDVNRLESIVNSLININHDIIFPIHPHTKKSLKKYGLYDKIINAEHIQTIKPVGYLDFLYLLSNSKLVLTDSGGVQEEAITLNVPCITLRYNTERPETILAGGNVLAGTNEEEIMESINNILNNKDVYDKMSNAVNPYGDGNSSKIILNIIKEYFEEKVFNENCKQQILDFEGYYLKEIKENISVHDFEQINENHKIEQIFSNGLPELIEKETDLNNKTIIVKKFESKN